MNMLMPKEMQLEINSDKDNHTQGLQNNRKMMSSQYCPNGMYFTYCYQCCFASSSKDFWTKSFCTLRFLLQMTPAPRASQLSGICYSCIPAPRVFFYILQSKVKSKCCEARPYVFHTVLSYMQNSRRSNNELFCKCETKTTFTFLVTVTVQLLVQLGIKPTV